LEFGKPVFHSLINAGVTCVPFLPAFFTYCKKSNTKKNNEIAARRVSRDEVKTKNGKKEEKPEQPELAEVARLDY